MAVVLTSQPYLRGTAQSVNAKHRSLLIIVANEQSHANMAVR
jgi:hypothetical protein